MIKNIQQVTNIAYNLAAQKACSFSTFENGDIICFNFFCLFESHAFIASMIEGVQIVNLCINKNTDNIEDFERRTLEILNKIRANSRLTVIPKEKQ